MIYYGIPVAANILNTIPEEACNRSISWN